MLKGFHDGPLLSVVDSNGALTTQPDQLKAVMLDHFTQVFDIPAANPLQQQNDQHLPAAVHTLLHDKQSVDPQWYKSLMDPVTKKISSTLHMMFLSPLHLVVMVLQQVFGRLPYKRANVCVR